MINTLSFALSTNISIDLDSTGLDPIISLAILSAGRSLFRVNFAFPEMRSVAMLSRCRDLGCNAAQALRSLFVSLRVIVTIEREYFKNRKTLTSEVGVRSEERRVGKECRS